MAKEAKGKGNVGFNWCRRARRRQRGRHGGKVNLALATEAEEEGREADDEARRTFLTGNSGKSPRAAEGGEGAGKEEKEGANAEGGRAERDPLPSWGLRSVVSNATLWLLCFCCCCAVRGSGSEEEKEKSAFGRGGGGGEETMRGE